MTETILPHEMPRALDRAPDTLKVLSLDCFDTLLWRDCYAPSDVFAGLTNLTTGQRMVSETYARKAQAVLHNRSEVGLDAIYEQALPNADRSVRTRLAEEEIALEARTCFGFAPTVELMRTAKARGLKVIIVSDTYLSSKQLTHLIQKAAGDEVISLIDRVFSSSDAGLSKSQGLLAKAMKTVKCKPRDMLHIGDNIEADFKSARALGIPALHLVQFGDDARQRLRFERVCQQLIGETREGVRGLMPHRALLAAQEPHASDRAEALGLSVLGPVFHAYDTWLRAEAEALEKQSGGTVHWLFMLRDGHLPHLVHQAGGEAPSTARVEISRFAAIAASLTTRDAYLKQFALEADLNPPTLARQMLFEEPEIEALVGDPQNEEERQAASIRLRAELKKGQRQKLTSRRARARADRLIEHVRLAVDPQPGDVLMLVDLGYNGSAQDRVDALLADAFDVRVAGRYLLLREKAATGLDKKGLIDDRHFDPELLEALCGNVAVIEQLATCEMGSVIDFTDRGEPIRKESAVKGAQSEVRDRVQRGVQIYAQAAARPPIVRRCDMHGERGLREAALATLTRFMFLPDAKELAVLKSFEHDVNLGSERTVALFDPAHAHEGLRRRGLFYMKGSERMFLPAELEAEDIHTRLSLLVQKRFGLGLSYTDGASHAITIPAIYLGETGNSKTEIEAQPTHEGYYVARLPLASGAKAVALMVGSVFEWFELAGITRSPVRSLKGLASEQSDPKRVAAQFDAITEHASGLLECTDPAATVLVLPPAQLDEEDPQMLEIVMRPLRRRRKVGVGSTNLNPNNQFEDAAA